MLYHILLWFSILIFIHVLQDHLIDLEAIIHIGAIVIIRCLKSLATRQFVQQLAQINNIKTPPKSRISGPLWGIPSVTGGFPSQRASNTESVSISWRRHISLRSVLLRWRGPGSCHRLCRRRVCPNHLYGLAYRGLRWVSQQQEITLVLLNLSLRKCRKILKFCSISYHWRVAGSWHQSP